MTLPIFQVDAFTNRVFAGNPAAVVPLEKWLDDATLQAIALENNLSETAFLVPDGQRYHLRWFTPAVEVDLCGHATLASAFVVLEYLEPARQEVRFLTRSGELVVRRAPEGDGLLEMDFPARRPHRTHLFDDLVTALGAWPLELWESRDYMALFGSEEEVRTLEPNFDLLRRVGHFAVIVTAPGKECDFVSRFFAPASGVDEDPVTGSAHCTLVPYWSHRLGKTSLHARQVSARGGELWCEDQGDRVLLKGHAVPYLRGQIEL
jgi:PhzF family phenazine biosynthesis protein